MSKNIKLNDTNYSGVSTVQLPTTDEGTAFFKDVDEITTPSGSTTITENGTYDVTNFEQAIVNVAASSGSTDVEQGTFVGDDTPSVEIPVSSLKKNIFICVEDFTTLNAETDDNLSLVLFYGNSELSHCCGKRSGTTYHTFTGVGSNVGGSCLNYVEFSDASVSVKGFKVGGAGMKLRPDYTYKWIAW